MSDRDNTRIRAEQDRALRSVLGELASDLGALGRAVARRRTALGWTVAGLSRLSGVNTTTICHVEAGRCHLGPQIGRVLAALGQGEAGAAAPSFAGAAPFGTVARRRQRAASVQSEIARLLAALPRDGERCSCGGPVARGRVHTPGCSWNGCECPPVRLGLCLRCGEAVPA